MVSFGLVGLSEFGKRVCNVLDSDPEIDLLWAADSESDIEELADADWIYNCSSAECHYENALDFMARGCNVIMENPSTLSVAALKYLIEKAREYGVEIYFSMVYLFDEQVKSIDGPSHFVWSKSSEGEGLDSAFAALLFHDLYIYLSNLLPKDIRRLKPKKIKFLSPDNFSFELRGLDKVAKFEYSRTSSSANLRSLNEIEIDSSQPDTLSKMLSHILMSKNTTSNKTLALNTMILMEAIRKVVFPNKVVIGAGAFGCCSAISLSAKGYNVDLIERNSEIMQEASSINQYRVHRGYHYPRSDETVFQCKESSPHFENKFRRALVDRRQHSKSYYAIASEKSKVKPEEYIKFLDRHNLQYCEKDIGLTGVDLTVQVTERLYDPFRLKELLANRIFSMGVNLKTSQNATKATLNDYSGGVIATYASQGYWDRSKNNYQFELCEKPIVRLPKRYRGISVVIMDGPFMCIDPYGSTDLHVLGNVVHAVHKTSYGDNPIIPKEYTKLLNSGCVTPPDNLTNINLFIQSAVKYFPRMAEAEYIGSMYTIRAVESNRDHDDARLSSLHMLDEKFIKIFSGKICTSIDMATKATVQIMKEMQS